MTVRMITTIQRFAGLAADVKPADAPEGSTFHCVDTGDEYVMHDGTWEKDLRLTKQQ